MPSWRERAAHVVSASASVTSRDSSALAVDAPPRVTEAIHAEARVTEPNRLLRLLCLPCFSLHELFANAKDTYVESLWIQFCFAI